MDFIKDYGSPGGLWLAYTLDLRTGMYTVFNEGGSVIATFSFEKHAQDFCEEHTG